VDDSKDLTLSPTFWAERGYGGDIQYRQRFSEMTWIETNNRFLNDTIYEPKENNIGKSGDEFFRYFTDIESHQFWSPDLNSHLHYNGMRDLDFVRDYPQFTDPSIVGSDVGFQGILNWRKDLFSFSAETNYARNQLFQEPMEFDREYVQTVPRVTLSSVPYSLVQSKVPFFQHIAVGADGSYTRFRQVDDEDDPFLRNVDRTSLQPYLLWHFLTLGPVSFRSKYTFDQQAYRFDDPDQPRFGKNAGLIRTEMSFTMDRIFGLAFEEKIPLKNLSSKDLQRLRESREQGLSPIQKKVKEERLVGKIPEFESELTKENIIQIRNSYRHSQEFKFVHHYIASQNEYGNKRFLAQISNPGPVLGQAGQFDYEDAIRSEEFLYGANTSRTMPPPQNTIEFQWNNTLIRKSPKSFSFLEDDKYLRDNFHYKQISYFNVSQGYLLNNEESEDFRERLTRLMIETGYSGDKWNFRLVEYYFHFDNENIFSLNFTRRFEYLNLFSNYSYNSFQTSELNTLSFGGQVRPTDVLGVAVVKDRDLEAKIDTRTTYSLDIMPHNNCWILNLNYQKKLDVSRYSFNIIFNFGDDNFERYRSDYFGVKRL
jgi:LPS-assembly protein